MRIATDPANHWLHSRNSQISAADMKALQSLLATKPERLPCPLMPAEARTPSNRCCSAVPTAGLAATMLPSRWYQRGRRSRTVRSTGAPRSATSRSRRSSCLPMRQRREADKSAAARVNTRITVPVGPRLAWPSRIVRYSARVS